VVSIFVSRLLADQPLSIFGDGKQTRDYVSVRDVARANVLASTVELASGEDHDTRAFNIATGIERSVLDLAAAAGRVTGRTPELRMEAARPGEILRSALDVTKAADVLGWRPEIVFEDGLAMLMDWFQTEG
jgi:UDP-glucose 4-epimerase